MSFIPSSHSRVFTAQTQIQRQLARNKRATNHLNVTDQNAKLASHGPRRRFRGQMAESFQLIQGLLERKLNKTQLSDNWMRIHARHAVLLSQFPRQSTDFFNQVANLSGSTPSFRSEIMFGQEKLSRQSRSTSGSSTQLKFHKHNASTQIELCRTQPDRVLSEIANYLQITSIFTLHLSDFYQSTPLIKASHVCKLIKQTGTG